MITLSALIAGWEAIDRLITPRPLENLGWLFAAGVLPGEALAWPREVQTALWVVDGWEGDLVLLRDIGTYDKFKTLFDKFSLEAGKKQFLIPYFIAAHPGTTDEDMMNLAVWLKKNGFRADQVQTFYPSPMATATAMYHTGLNPLKGVHRDERGEKVDVVRGEKRRRLHKAFLRYHDPANWPLLRDALKAMGRADLIGNGKQHLIPTWQPLNDGAYQSPRRKNSSVAPPKSEPVKGRLLTQHTGLPPRASGGTRPGSPVGGGKRKGR